MKLAFQLAWLNLLGAGLRTWLNVIVLSFSFVIIIWLKGVLMGWDYQARTDMKEWEIAEGQWWQQSYDPYDPLSITDSHAAIPDEVQQMVSSGLAEPALLIQASIFPNGRMQTAFLKGIRPDQKLFRLPVAVLDTTIESAIPVVIGTVMARSTGLKPGDVFTIRWRDSYGTYDAADAQVVQLFSSNVPAVEAGTIYMNLTTLQKMTLLDGNATIISFADARLLSNPPEGWVSRSVAELTKQVDDLIKTKSGGQTVLHMVLLLLAMLAIFDTQVLSIFRRQKEIGTYVALGYTRREVVGLFTLEGSMHAVLAAMLGAVYGIPLLAWQASAGWELPMDASEFGMAMAPVIYPVYSLGLIVSTVLIVFITTGIVSYLPSRKIAKMNPTEALRGKLQ